MKTVEWTIMMYCSIAFMICGAIVSALGISADNHIIAYGGITIMSTVCVGWWFWVMFIIKDTFLKMERASKHIGETKHEIGFIRALIQRLLDDSRDK